MLLAVLMVVLMGAGCAPTDQPDDAGSQESQNDQSQATDIENVPSGTKITLMTYAGASPEYTLESTPNYEALRGILLERFGIDLVLEAYPGEQLGQVVNTRLATSDIPDIINYEFSQQRLLDVYNKGLILKLNDLIESDGPNVKKMFEAEPYVAIANGDRDGAILRIPNLVSNPQQQFQCMHIRQDWLEAVGMEMPTNTEELYEVLKAFRDQDANGNGVADEIVTGWPLQLNLTLSSAFGVKMMSAGYLSFYPDENGKIYHTMTDENAREYFRYVNRLVKEGIIDGEIFNQNVDQYNEKFYNDRVALCAGMYWESLLNNSSIKSRGNTWAEYIPLTPLEDQYGERHVVMELIAGGDGYMISSNCAAPELAMKYLDYCISPEGTSMIYYGCTPDNPSEYWKVTTETYGLDLSDEIILVGTEKYTSELANNASLWQMMGWDQALGPRYVMGGPADVAYEFYTAYGVEQGGRAAEIDFNMNFLSDIINTYGIEGAGFASPTQEEADIWNECNELFLYLDEMYLKFMSGAASVETDWDNYLAVCERLGLSKAIAVRQAQYDAYLEMIGK